MQIEHDGKGASTGRHGDVGLQAVAQIDVLAQGADGGEVAVQALA